MTTCSVCGESLPAVTRTNPVNSNEFRSESVAVFDIDNTILDSSQRFQDAYRAGLTDKEGKAKKKKALESMGKAVKRRNEFLYKPTNLAKDKVIAGSQALINDLIAKGYVIAYLTARPAQFHTETYNQLEEKGFPIFRDNSGEILLRTKGALGVKPGTYKTSELVKLSQQYDVRMFFDDDKDTLSAVASENMLDIPGLYSSIKEYRQYHSRSNPMQYIVREGSDEDEESADPSGYGFYGFTGDVDYEDANRRNPPVKPRRKKMKNGKYRKEPAKKYVDRFMGNSKMVSEFPDAGQRYAVCLTYVEKYYGKRGLDSVGARRNPEEYSENYMVPRDIHRLGKAADRLEDTYEDGQEVPEWWKSKLSVTAKDADTIADSLDYVAQNPSEELSEQAQYIIDYTGRQDWVERALELGRDIDFIENKLITFFRNEKQREMVAEHGDEVRRIAFERDPYAYQLGEYYIDNREEILMGGYTTHEINVYEDQRHEVKVGTFAVDQGGDFHGQVEFVLAWDYEKKLLSEAGVRDNPPTEDVLTVFTGEPTSNFTNKGMVTAEVQIGRGIVKDIGEGIQDIYRGLVGGRQSMTEKRMAMAVATMHKELSDRAKAKGGNAVANLQIDYEYPTQGDLTLMATADAIKMTRAVRSNPSNGIIAKHCFLELYDCDPKLLNDESFIRNMMTSAAQSANMQLLNLSTHQFEPQGITGLALLGESHISIHTWPESGYAMIDVLTCGEPSMPEKACELIRKKLKAKDHKQKCFLRDTPPNMKMGKPAKNNPRKNPSNPKKVEKAKKLYKHMNGQEPEKIEKKKIDMGDVWYQVGEGGCWQIGYMSGKETGNSQQKYTHTFNEETKDGNFPKLYATMPENGKPLLIIQGGTWKIKTDDQGVAWIYD